MTTRTRYINRFSTGKCVNCGKEHSGEFKYCQACRDRNKARYVRHAGKERPKVLTCKLCKNEFPVKPDGIIPTYCPNCREKYSYNIIRRLVENPNAIPARREYQKEYMRRWRNTRHRVYLDTSLRRHYGITLEQYVTIYDKQSGLCAICKDKLPDWDTKGKARRNIHLDHNHETGKVRGILCNSCNFAIGLLKDSCEIAESAFKYLLSFRG